MNTPPTKTPPTKEALMAAYPGCAKLIDFCVADLGEKGWETVRERQLSPSQVISLLRHMIRKGIGKALPQLLALPEDEQDYVAGRFLEVLKETEHPDFLKYVRAKLGAM